MKVVVDTNVLVSGLLNRGGPPAQVVDAILSGELTPLHDARIIDEYREVLARPKFKLPREQVSVVIDFIVEEGVEVTNAPLSAPCADPDDQPFLDVAVAGAADFLITGNTKDFPKSDPVSVVTPREWLDHRASQTTDGEAR